MGKFYNWFINKVRGIRFSITTGLSGRTYNFGAIYSGPYQNYKHDPTPLILCMYSDSKYTHGIQLHYMNNSDREWMIKTLYMVKKYNQYIDGRRLYNFIKMQRYNIIKTCYRKYHTGLCKFRLVAAGITPLEKMVYSSNEPFVKRLNEALSPMALSELPRQVAYSPQELQDRIVEGMNAIPIQQRTLAGNVPPAANPFGTAPWVRRI